MKLSIIIRPYQDENIQPSEIEVVFEGQPGEIAAPFREIFDKVTKPFTFVKSENPKNPEKVGTGNKAKLDFYLEQTRMNKPKDDK